MRVTLERKDLLAILSKALRYEIQDEDVTIDADPFEVHIKQLPVDELVPTKASEPATEVPDDTDGEDYLEESPEVA